MYNPKLKMMQCENNGSKVLKTQKIEGLLLQTLLEYVKLITNEIGTKFNNFWTIYRTLKFLNLLIFVVFDSYLQLLKRQNFNASLKTYFSIHNFENLFTYIWFIDVFTSLINVFWMLIEEIF